MEFLNDYELLYLIRQENEWALDVLFRKYEKMLWSIVNKNIKYYTKVGIDSADFMQHAYISFYQSIGQYREDRNASFSTFAYICIERKIKTAVRDLFRGSNMFHLECLSMDQDVYNAENIALIDTIENPYPEYCPVWQLQLKEEQATMESCLGLVKPVEREIFVMWRDGYTYGEIAKKVKLETKYVDNTIQKIKKIKNRSK